MCHIKKNPTNNSKQISEHKTERINLIFTLSRALESEQFKNNCNVFLQFLLIFHPSCSCHIEHVYTNNFNFIVTHIHTQWFHFCVIFHMRAVWCLFSWNFFLTFLSYYSSTLFPQATVPQPRAVKRQRLMTPVQARPTAIIASPTQVVLQPQQQQQIVGANSLTTAAANSLLQLQQQQQQILIANSGTLLNLCNSKQNQAFANGSNGSSSSNKSCNGDNNENVNQQNSIAGPFKVYSEYICAAD